MESTFFSSGFGKRRYDWSKPWMIESRKASVLGTTSLRKPSNANPRR